MTKVTGYKRDLYIQLFKKKKVIFVPLGKKKNWTFSIRGTFTESPHNDFEMRTD